VLEGLGVEVAGGVIQCISRAILLAIVEDLFHAFVVGLEALQKFFKPLIPRDVKANGQGLFVLVLRTLHLFVAIGPTAWTKGAPVVVVDISRKETVTGKELPHGVFRKSAFALAVQDLRPHLEYELLAIVSRKLVAREGLESSAELVGRLEQLVGKHTIVVVLLLEDTGGENSSKTASDHGHVLGDGVSARR